MIWRLSFLFWENVWQGGGGVWEQEVYECSWVSGKWNWVGAMGGVFSWAEGHVAMAWTILKSLLFPHCLMDSFFPVCRIVFSHALDDADKGKEWLPLDSVCVHALPLLHNRGDDCFLRRMVSLRPWYGCSSWLCLIYCLSAHLLILRKQLTQLPL